MASRRAEQGVLAQGRVKTLELGRFSLTDIVTNLAPAGGMKNRTGLNGVLGNGVLSRFKVTLDYSRRRMMLEPARGEGIKRSTRERREASNE